MTIPTAPLTPPQVLQLLTKGAAEEWNNLRAQHPSWIPKFPLPRTFDLKRTDLSNRNLKDVDFSEIDLSWSDLRNSMLDFATLSQCKLIGANLQGTSLVGTVFVGCTGLTGENRAIYSPYNMSVNSGAEQAIFMERGDLVPWSLLRSISTFRVFGASYITIAVLVAYASLVEWINTTALEWATIPPEDGGLRQQLRELLLSQLPLVEVAPHFGIQILMVICLAIGATVYHLFCPDFVKENSESRWTRELNQSLVEYRSANATFPIARAVALFFYGIGGLYTFIYMFVRVVGATLYFLKGG